MLKGDKDIEGYQRQISARPPVLLIHGDADDVIPTQALFHSTQALAELGVPTEWHLSQGVGHGIDGEGLRQGGEFLARRLRETA